MSTKRIKTGFHRIGVVLAAICAVPGAALIGFWVFGAARDQAVMFGVLFLAAGMICYLLAIAVGWIASGFAGSGES
jgi:hypothetical protein